MTAFSHSPGLLNGVGYNTTDNTAGESSFIFGSSFNSLAVNGVIPFASLTSPEGLEDEDRIETAWTDEDGITHLYDYVYYGEWYNEDMDPVSEEDGIPVGCSAWFLSSTPKTITTAGEVLKGNFIHTFTDASALASSAFPVAFCPNSENVSWGVGDEARIETAWTDEDGVTHLYDYVYYSGDGWYNEDMDILDADTPIVGAGVGFWMILNDATETFTEVSPISE